MATVLKLCIWLLYVSMAAIIFFTLAWIEVVLTMYRSQASYCSFAIVSVLATLSVAVCFFLSRLLAKLSRKIGPTPFP